MVMKDLFDNIIACVIEAYGAGNLPINRPDVREALLEACKAGRYSFPR